MILNSLTIARPREERCLKLRDLAIVNVSVVWVLCCFPQLFSHIMTVSGCNRELHACFYNAASLKHHVPDA